MSTDLVVTPHPLTLEGRSILQAAELRPGETLATFLTRHGVDLSRGDWIITIGGALVPRLLWDRTRPQHGHLIECRRAAGKSALRIVALVALTYFTMGMAAPAAGMAGGLAGSLGMSAGFAAFALNAGAFMLGSMLINKLLPPPKMRAPQYESTAPTYSLSGGRNRIRPYEPLALVFGQVRVVPDYAAQPFAWFESNDQYQYIRLHGGINCGEVSELRIGTTAIEQFTDVTIAKAGFPGVDSQLLDWSNVDSINGASLESPTDNSGPGAWVERTSSADTVRLAIDLTASLYEMSDTGKMRQAVVQIDAEYRLLPSGPWLPLAAANPLTLQSNTTKPVRQTFQSETLVAGQYQVRCRKVTKTVATTKAANAVDWVTLKSFQLDSTDYSSHPHVGIRIKATGQLNGAVDELSWLVKQAAAPVWDGSAWQMVPGTRNPGAHILRFARGIYDTSGRLMAGMGLPDSQIDVEGLKGFILHCAEKGYTFDYVFTSLVSCHDALEAMAAAGLGSISYHPGRLSVVWARDDQPVEAVVNMANIKRGTFRVDYATRESAEEIEVAWIDRDDDWRDRTLRIKAPAVTMPRDTARYAPLGVTTQAGGLLAGRFSMAQNIYQRKSVTWEMDLEHLTFRRWSLVALSHDMTRWGAGGRLHGATEAGGVVTLQLDASITAPVGAGAFWVGVRPAGYTGYMLLPVRPFTGEVHELVIDGAWPSGVALPGQGTPAFDTLWIFDFKAQPGQRLRITSIEPTANLAGAKITGVPEGPEFWHYIDTGEYEAPPVPVLLLALEASNVAVTQDRLGLTYDEQTQLTVTFDVVGSYDHAQVWGAPTGLPLELLGETRTTRFGPWTVALDGLYDIEVRPFDALGRPGRVAGAVYDVQLDPLKTGVRFVKLRATSLMFRVPRSGSGVVSPSSITINLDRGGAGLDAAAVWTTTPTIALGGTGDERTLAYADMAHDAVQISVVVEQDGKLYVDTLSLFKVYDGLDAPGSVVDLTPPPAVEGIAVRAGLSSIFAEWTAPTYTVGHGPGKVAIYGKRRLVGDPEPVFADAAVIGEPVGSPWGMPTDIGATWHLWAKHVSADGVESEAPAGGLHGLVATASKIGTHDLSDRLIEAEQLADDAVIERAIAAKAVNYQQLAEGAVRVQHLLVAPKSLIVDPSFSQGLVGWTNWRARFARTAPEVPAGCPVEFAAVFNGRDGFMTTRIPVIAGEQYRVTGWVYRNAALPNTGYVAFGHDATGTIIQTTVIGVGPATGWTRAAGDVVIAANVVSLGVAPWNEQAHGGSVESWFADLQCEKKNDASLIVDGTLEARHIKSQTITAASGVFAEGAITRFMLGVGSVDDAIILNLSATKLTAGDGTIGGRLKSANFDPGVAGWIVRPDGSAEFNSITIRNSLYTGTVYAGAGMIGDVTISGNGLAAGALTGWAWPAAGAGGGFYLGPNGLLLGNYNSGQWVQINQDGSLSMPGFSVSGGNAYFSGTLSAAGGSFSGALLGATGTFSGSLTAAAVNAVDTINIAGNAVTVPASARTNADIAGIVNSSLTYNSTTGVYNRVALNALAFTIDPRGGAVWAISTGRLRVRKTSTGVVGGTIFACLYINDTLQQQVALAAYGTANINVSLYEYFTLAGSLAGFSGSVSVRLAIETSGSTNGWDCSLLPGAVLIGQGGRR